MAKLNVSTNTPPLLHIEPFRGVNTSVTPTLIHDRQSPDMRNINIDEQGSLNKRTGYKRIFAKSLGDGSVKGMFLFETSNGTKQFLFAHNGKLYSTDTPSIDTLATWNQDDLSQTWESEVL